MFYTTARGTIDLFNADEILLRIAQNVFLPGDFHRTESHEKQRVEQPAHLTGVQNSCQNLLQTAAKTLR